MTFSQIFVLLVVLIPLGFVAINRLRIDVAALLMTVILAVAQFCGLATLGAANTPGDATKAISGLGQPVVTTLFSLFIITQCLDQVGVTRWIALRVMRLAGDSERGQIMLFTATTAFMSLFMNNLAAGALLLPSAMEVSRKTGIRPSKLLIPVAYGSLLGGAATYFTTANIITSNLLITANPPQAPLGVLDFTPTGGLVALAGIAFLTIFGKRILPNRELSSEAISPQLPEDQAVNRVQAGLAISIAAIVVIVSILGFPVYLATLAGAVLIFLLRLYPMQKALRRMEWSAIILIAGMYSVSTAMVNTGLAALIGQNVVALVAPLGAIGLAAGAYWLTAILTQFMGGQVSALVTAPITISAAITMHVNPQAIAVVTAIGCSASFFTPVAHPVNLLMIRPANYKFTDFLRAGWLLTLICFAALMVGVVLFWRL